MIRKRVLIQLLPLLLLILALFNAARIVVPTAANPGAAVATGQAPVGATPTPTPRASSARAVARSFAAVQRAFNAGDVRLLCRSGAVVDRAVIRRQNAGSRGCESELETLMPKEPPPRLAVRPVRAAARPSRPPQWRRRAVPPFRSTSSGRASAGCSASAAAKTRCRR